MRVMIAATKSGAGKTTVVCGLIELLKRRGLKVSALKSGPDYIDPMFHKTALGIPSGNADCFMSDREHILRQFGRAEKRSDILIAEGAMGYFDGIGFTDRASCAELAWLTATPVVLIVDSASCGYSSMAVLKGFIDMDRDLYGGRIRGVIFNRMNENLYRKASEETLRLGIVPCGYIPTNRDMGLESRHLGLITPNELDEIEKKLDFIADIIEKTVDTDNILRIASDVPVLSADCESVKKYTGLKIAVTSDKAFSFVYDDFIAAVEEHGAELIGFSPIADEALPEGIAGLYICGGYPENYLRELSANKKMMNSIRRAIEGKMPTIAECGGYMYLSEGIRDENGDTVEMVGIVKGICSRQKRPVHFGYGRLRLDRDCLIGKCGAEYPVHSYHYYETDCIGDGFEVIKESDGSRWREGTATDSLYAGFPHFYMNSDMLEGFLDKCDKWRKNEGRYF